MTPCRAPRPRPWLAPLLIIAALGRPGPCGEPAGAPPRLAAVGRWACFYGNNLSESAWRSLDLAVVDPDNFVIPSAAAAGSGPQALAYVSAGEADERRWFWTTASSGPYLVEANPLWPSAHRVDLRDKAWRSLLLDKVVPAALGKGYRGVMLDTLDTAEYLEAKDPARFGGSKDAVVELVRSLRERHPETAILVNNALPLLDRLGPFIDGVLVEDLYTRCHAADAACKPTPSAVAAAKEKTLKAFSAGTGKPVFVILYANLKQRDSRWIRKAVRRCLRNGFKPYIASPSLERLGRVYPPNGS